MTDVFSCKATLYLGKMLYSLTVEGKCYTFGSNQFGQLGYEKEPQDRRPAQVKALNSCKLSAVACGDTFTMAVSEGRSKIVVYNKMGNSF